MSETVETGQGMVPPLESIGPHAAINDESNLQGKLGTTSVVLTVVAYLAPLGAAAGYIPFVIGYGNGLGAPLIFLLCGVILTLFSFGYLAMVRQVPRPGAFYAYISAGLGKRVGLGAGALTLMFYILTGVGFYIFGGVSMQTMIQDIFGVDLPWWAYVALLVLLVGFTSYRGIDFNARVLGFIVALEFLIIAVFNIVTIFKGGVSGHTTETFTWSSFTSGSIAVGVLFAIAFFTGFESTAIFREEARNPRRTIPRATYIVVGTISIFYFVTAYCFIIALGAENATAITAGDPSRSFDVAVSAMLGNFFSQFVSVMVVTSVLASELAIANVTTRYFYSFGVDRVLPRALSTVHERHGSPHRAALVTTAITAAGVLAILAAGFDPRMAYGIFSGVLEFGFEVLVLLVSVAVIVYFQRNRASGERRWSTVVAPAITIVSFGWLLYFSFARSELLLGTRTPLISILFVLLGGSLVVGVGFASYLSVRRPDVYARIGRAEG